MSLLPTAHAGQAYGARRIDFFTVSGQVSRSDGATGRVRDDDGMDHDIRLTESTSALAPGDSATILRVQAGPNRRSRPVAIVNHSRETWMRAAPDATALLARSGITRGFNWWLSILLLAVTALASVWPLLHAFLTEMNGAMMSGIPAYSVLGELDAYAPALAGWRLETALPTGLLDAIAALGIVPMDQLTAWGLALGGAGLTMIAYGARSWRLLYVPVFAGFALMAGVILGGPGATLALVGGAVLLFLIGGLFNRIRDAGRFNARVERLAEHVLRNPPQESVRTADTGAGDGAAAALAGAGAAAMLAGHTDAAGETADEEEPGEPASPGDDAANGEAEAGPELELPPAAADPAVSATTETSARPDEAGEAAAAAPAAGDGDEAEASENPASEDEAGEDETSATPAAAADGEAVETDDASGDEGGAPGETGDAIAADAPDEPVVALDETEAAADPDGEDDDLPSLDAVAAAAALTAAEQSDPEEAGDDMPATTADSDDTASAAVLEEDERTMPLASPPPMPAAGENDADAPPAETAADAAEPLATDQTSSSAEDVQTTEMPQSPGDDSGTDSPALGEVEDRVAAAVEAAGAGQQATARPPVDDPLLDDSGSDPMLPKSQAGDTAPGAPEVDVEKDETESAN